MHCAALQQRSGCTRSVVHRRYPQLNSTGQLRSLTTAKFTKQSQPVQEAQRAAVQKLQQANKDLGPYLLWDKALKLRAVWDSRSHNQAELENVVKLLEQQALDSITLDTTQGGRGQPLTSITVVVRPEDGDTVAAALLQLTPATHITATSCEQCYLPQHTLPIPTAYGPVDAHISLAGSRVCKIAPDWQQCETAAAAAAAGNAAAPAAAAAGDGVLQRAGETGGGVDARVVAAAAVQALRAGLENGSVQLAVQNLF